MSVRSTPGALYANDTELAFLEGEIARIMYAAGLDWADIDTTTIDDIVNKIRETFNGGDPYVPHNATNSILAAPDEWLRGQRDVLTDPLRRAWRRRHMALARA